MAILIAKGRLEEKDLNSCVKWVTTCRLESDIIIKGAPLPNLLACAFCKTTHPHDDFRSRKYGFQYLGMAKIDTPPFQRYCWRHFPVKISYCPVYRDKQQEKWAIDLLEDHWIATSEPTCLHCTQRLTTDLDCPACPKQCDICGYIELRIFARFGPARPFESYQSLHLVKRRKMEGALEIEDENSINMRPPLRHSSIYSGTSRYSRCTLVKGLP